MTIESNDVSYAEFAIICAKSEELRQVIDVFDERKLSKVRGRHRADQVYEVPSKDGAVLRVVVTTCNAMGHMTAAIRTAQIVMAHQPQIVMFLGTAASLVPEEIQVGDVVVPKMAINRFYDKISELGQKDYEKRTARGSFKERFFGDNALIAEMAMANCSETALGAMASIKPKDIKFEVGSEGEITIDSVSHKLRTPKLVEDVDILSCGMLVDSVSYRNFLKQAAEEHYSRKVGIIDMESHGFFTALDALKRQPPGTLAEGLMIRGISDYAGRKQQLETVPSDWKNLSVRNAASVAYTLMMKLAEV